MSTNPFSYLLTGEQISSAFPEGDYTSFPSLGSQRIPDKAKISALFCSTFGLSFGEAAASDASAAAALLGQIAAGAFEASAASLTRLTLKNRKLEISFVDQICALEQISDSRMQLAALTLLLGSLEISSPQITDSRRIFRLLGPRRDGKELTVARLCILGRLLTAQPDLGSEDLGGAMREALLPGTGGVTHVADFFLWCAEKNKILCDEMYAESFLNVVVKMIGNFSTNWPQIANLANNLPKILRPVVSRRFVDILWASEELSIILQGFVGMFPIHLGSFLEILGMLGENSRKFLAETSVCTLLLPRNFQAVETVEEAVLRLHGFSRNPEICSQDFSVFTLGRNFQIDGNFLWTLIAAATEICASGNFLTEAQKALVGGALEICGNLEIFPDEKTEMWMARNLGCVIGNFAEIWVVKSRIPLKLIDQVERISDCPEIFAQVVERASVEDLERNLEATGKILKFIGIFDEKNFRLATALIRKKFPDLLDENSEYAIRGREIVRGKFPDSVRNQALTFLSEISWKSEISPLVVDAMTLASENFPAAPKAVKALLAGRKFRVQAAQVDLIEKILASEISDCVAEVFASRTLPQKLQASLVEKFHEADAALAVFLRSPREISDFPAALVPKFAEGCVRLLARGLATVGARKSELLEKSRKSLAEFSIGNFFRDENLASAVRLLVLAVRAAGGAVEFPRSLHLSSSLILAECQKFPSAVATALDALGEWAASAGTGDKTYESEISSLRGVLGSSEVLGERIVTAASVLLALLGGDVERIPKKNWTTPILIEFELAKISDLQEIVTKAGDKRTVALAITGVAGASEAKFQELGPWLATWLIGNFSEFPDAGLVLMCRLALEARSSVIGNFREIGIRFVQTWRDKFLGPFLTAASEGTVDSLGRALLVVTTLRALGLPFSVDHLIGLLGASENLEFPIFFCTSVEQKIAAGVLPSSSDEKFSEPAGAPSVLHQTAEFMVVKIFEEAVMSGEWQISFDMCLEIVARLKNLLVKHKTDPQTTLVVEDERVPLSVEKFVDEEPSDRKKEEKITDILSLFEVKKRTSDKKNTSKKLKQIDSKNLSRFPVIPESLAVNDWVDVIGNVTMVALVRAYEYATKDEQVLSLFDLMELLKAEAVLKGKAEILLEELVAKLKPLIFTEEPYPAISDHQPGWTQSNPALPW